MAKYRQIHIEFWQDGFVLDLTPEEKYFYIYLMTNSKTSQCGIYELPKRIIETETGYNRETVEKLLKRFIDYGKIQYDEATKEIFVVNWLKYNAIKSPKVIACVEKELLSIKSTQFMNRYYTLCKRYGYPINSPTIQWGEEEEQEEEKEEEQEAQIRRGQNAFSYYENNISTLSSYTAEELKYATEEFGDEVVIEAIKLAAANNKRMWSYINGILKKWRENNVKSLEDIKTLDANRKSGGQSEIDWGAL